MINFDKTKSYCYTVTRRESLTCDGGIISASFLETKDVKTEKTNNIYFKLKNNNYKLYNQDL